MLKIQEFIMILTKKFPKSFYEDTITLMLKPDKDTTKKELQASIFDGYRCKTLQENISKLSPTTHRKDHTPWSRWIHFRVTRMVQYMQINWCDIPHHQKKGLKSHDAEKALDKIQYPFMIKKKPSHQSGYREQIST